MVRSVCSPLVTCLVLLAGSTTVQAEVRSVGPGKTFAAPCAAFASASDGDTIEIDGAGSYVGDVCAVARSNLTIKGVNGRPHIAAGGKSSGGKATWVVTGRDTIIDNIEFSGARVPDKNGAGIRQEGRNLTVRRCYFHDNENGILGGADAESVYLIEDSEFANNGAGDGQSHNMYIGEIKSFTLRGCYSHDAAVGHLVKSRALANYISYNRLSDEAGTASYELDLPQGGVSYVVGNVFEKSPSTTGNSSFVSFAREAKQNPSSALWVVSNTFYSMRSGRTFVAVASDVASVTLRNNIFAGAGNTVCDLPGATVDNNVVGTESFVDAAQHDFHLLVSSTAVDHGVSQPAGLAPECQYVHPARAVVRKLVGTLDQGAFELGEVSTIACGQTSPPSASGGSDAGTTGAASADAGARPTETTNDAGLRADAGATPVVTTSDGGSIDPAGADAGASPDAQTKDGGGCSSSPSPNSQIWGSFMMLMLSAVALRRRFK